MAGVSNANVAQIDEAQMGVDGRLARCERVIPALPPSEGEWSLRELGSCYPWPHGAASAAPTGSSRTSLRSAELQPRVGASPQAGQLAWMLAKGPRVIPIPGEQLLTRDGSRLGCRRRPRNGSPHQVARLDDILSSQGHK